ncbi:MAG TPA: hypothetical protein DCM05_03450 [Elusimicrobia bacterium]|nr:hypothetical protein [Elusimicrobiota bacterium]
MRADWWRSFFTPKNFPIGELTGAEATRREARELLRVLRLPRGAKVLDLCCGMGRHSRLLARAGLQVTGFDQSRSYLAAARKSCPGVRFVRGDMRELPFDSEFDAVVNLWTSFGYFRRAGDDRRALRAMRRALKPGGTLALELLDGGWLVGNFAAKDWRRKGAGWWLESRRLRRGKDPGVFAEMLLISADGKARGGEVFTRLYGRSRLERELGRAGFDVLRLRGGLMERGLRPPRCRRILALARRP